MATITQIFKSYIECVNEERWHDLPEVVSFPHKINKGVVDSPQVFADRFASIARLHLEVDATTADEKTQRLGATITVNVYALGNPESKTTEREQILVWAKDGKIYQVATLTEKEDPRGQGEDTEHDGSPQPDLIATYTAQTTPTDESKKLSRTELEDTYRAYIGCINTQAMTTELPRFCHAHVVHNARRLSLEDYGGLIQEAFTAVPDIVFGIDTVVPDERAQRIAVRLEFTGTPTGTMAGAEPTGKSVRFYEYVTYAFRDGKIDRVWSIVDWDSYRQQLSQT
ncbi:hypothetical protein F5Y08DRAFT_46158 [Xylaria arbuscula]|nr:hypothetical protein F5Y08DRAFT_46158 [Xylaria arbuscula]